MCGGSPKIEAPKPAPPPPAPPPPPPPTALVPVQTAATESSSDKKRKGRDALRIDLTDPASGAASGLNIPV